MTTRLYLDDRKSNGAPAPLKLSITKNGKAAYIGLDIRLQTEQWDKKTQRVIAHPQKTMLNNIIASKRVELERKLFELQEAGKLATLSATQIKDLLTKKEEVITFGSIFRAFANKKDGRTKEIYNITLKHLCEYADIDAMAFDEVTPSWLEDFDDFLEDYCPSKNGRNIHLRNIRAVFNYAIDNDYTHYYPFRVFKIKHEATRKRSLDVDTLRKVFTIDVPERDKKFQTAFKLMFYLIGINVIDFCEAVMVNGRLEYKRCKTKKLYSIKVEPEAMECIEQLSGTKHLLYPLDHYKSYKTFADKLNHALDRISTKLEIPRITTYWARHSWATIAHSIGVPKDTISMALGHSFGVKTTDVYIDYNAELVDAANRKVIDYINKAEAFPNATAQ